MSFNDIISLRGAAVNNLKNVDLDLPRNKFIVITGLSGSGKSSLAFDTLYAEGQRRYVESLSSYARQFVGRMSKPSVESLRGLPPAIAIEQKVTTRNPRSTVGTSTEIYDYLRLLYGRVGKTVSPVSGEIVRKHTVEDVIAAFKEAPAGCRAALLAPLVVPRGRDLKTHLAVLSQQGYARVTVGDEITDIDAVPRDTEAGDVWLVVDRLVTGDDADELSRLAESSATAFWEGGGRLRLVVWNGSEVSRRDFSELFEADGITFPEPDDQMFNFNNPYGACPRCEGYGRTVGIDERLVVPNPALSVYEDAVACWKGEKMSEWKHNFIMAAPRYKFPVHKPYCQLTDAQKELLWKGDGRRLEGIDAFFKMVDENLYKIQYRVMLARYRGRTVCPDCQGRRLRPETQNVLIAGQPISSLVTMPVDALLQWFNALQLDERDTAIASRILKEIKNRLGYLCDVGLGYLTLDRLSNTLSGGESQRINLATSLGSSLVGSMYILDEPSIGLHPRDTHRLIGVLRKLQQLGNTVIVVEHDEEIMCAADHLVDVGPLAGRLGGEIVYSGRFSGLENCDRSLTAAYLTGSKAIEVPAHRRRSSSYIEIKGAMENNLKGVDVRFPLGVMTVVTGVSGSGKSTLVRDILYRALAREKGQSTDAPGAFTSIGGDVKRLAAVEFVDQNPIGKSTRSNAATYLKAYDEIRQLYASQQASKQLGFTPSTFSFNAEGGRCEECKGEGTVTIPMQFMADITIQCEECGGKRFKKEVLDVQYRGNNIHDILEMTVEQAIEFFGEDKSATCRRIVSRLQPLADVGLGYIKLGQSSSTLSGGENQRVKLASFLADQGNSPTMFIFDEPTTGLHIHDISRLLDSFNRLIAKGHTVVIIEHNMDVVKCADHVIDIGPEGGDGGGTIVACGTPEQVAAAGGHTARFLAPKLKARQ